jgi:hypothetical protein
VGCRHSIMIESWRARPAALAGHADAAAHDLKGDALHALRGEEGLLLAGATQYEGWQRKRNCRVTCAITGLGRVGVLGRRLRQTIPRARPMPLSLVPLHSKAAIVSDAIAEGSLCASVLGFWAE